LYVSNRILYFTSHVGILYRNIWIEFSTLAKEFAKVDFGQGQPSYAPQSYIAETLSQVALEGNNFLQYTREVGHPR